uniref:Uncharacterized protein n=1 Tax=Candidatus Methanophaga sp. ANME-1 ERB7 TaxID=2759913 RepID=A0A7G9Z4S4_9EURY|nr:hypothetical protein NKHFOMCA_00001 [Methanosarcinales archaeon ANME-1 ERB7]
MDGKITAFMENSGEAAAKGVEAKLICISAEFKPSWSGTDPFIHGQVELG